MAGNTVEIIIKAATDKALADVKKFTTGFSGHMDAMKTKTGAAMKSIENSISSTAKGLVNLKTIAATAFIGWGIERLAKDFLDTAVSFDKMKLSLDTITKGKGEETFKALNEWAMKMPVNTQKAIESFIMMRAMGLEPTIAQMTTLVDTMAALGGKEDTLQSIARSLAQIQTKGKLSAEELMQLAERGVPAMEIIRKKFGDIDHASIKAGDAVQALFTGMAERFGGQSEKLQNTWSGLTESLKSYGVEFQRLFMESGPMKVATAVLKEIVGYADRLYREGTLKKWAEESANKVLESVKSVLRGAGQVADVVSKFIPPIKAEIESLWKTFSDLPGWVQDAGLVGAVLLGKKGMVLLGGGLHLTQAIQNSVKGAQAVLAGKLSFGQYATTNFGELAGKLSGLEGGGEGEFYRGPSSAPVSYSAWADKAVGAIDAIQESANNAAASIEKATQQTATFFDYTAAQEGRNPFVFEPQITMSPAVPWREGIASMEEDLAGIGKSLTGAMDLSGIAGITANMKSLSWTLMEVQDMQNSSLMDPRSMGVALGEQRRLEQLYNLQLKALKQSVYGASGGGGGGGGVSVVFNIASMSVGAGVDGAKGFQEAIANDIKYGRSPILREIQTALA